MIRMPDCSFSAGIVFLSVSAALFGISPSAKGKPHRLHTDTWIGLTSPHCLHFELVIERSEIPMLSNPTSELRRRRESKQASPDQLSYETSRYIGTRVQRFAGPRRTPRFSLLPLKIVFGFDVDLVTDHLVTGGNSNQFPTLGAKCF